jgi:hypothetical protein
MDIFWEAGNEISGSIREEELLDQVCDYQLLRKDFVQWSSLVIECNKTIR